MRVQVRHGCAAVAVVVALWGTAGCGAEDEAPRAEPSGTESVASSAPVVVESKGPELRDDTPEAAIEDWIDARTSMQNTGDTGPFRALSSITCEYCSAFADQVEVVYTEGGNAQIGASEITSIRFKRSKQLGAHYETSIRTSAAQLTRSGGAITEMLPASKDLFQIHVVRDDGSWKVRDIALVTQ
jgi:hypothetical protein